MSLNLASDWGDGGERGASWNELQLGVSPKEAMLPGSTKASDFSRQVRNPDFLQDSQSWDFYMLAETFFQNSGWAGGGKQNKSVFQMWSLGQWFATSAEIFFLE